MKHIYQDDSLTLHTDLYQINMVETYWRDGIHNKRAVFELFFRSSRLGMDMLYSLAWKKSFSLFKAFVF